MDHTAILQFLGERFGNGHYSPAVDTRINAGLESISAVLSLSDARVDIPPPPGVSQGFTTSMAVPFDSMSQAFNEAFAGLNARFPDEVSKRFPKLSGHFGQAVALPKPKKAAAKKSKKAGSKKKKNP